MNAFAVTSFLNRFLYYPVVLIFVLNLLQRRHLKEGTSKRLATLYIGIGLLALWGYTYLSNRLALGDLYLIPVIIVIIGVCIFFRRHVFPFRLFCERCGQRLHLREFFYIDSNRCSTCEAPKKGAKDR
jgi:fatty acid desaturase